MTLKKICSFVILSFVISLASGYCASENSFLSVETKPSSYLQPSAVTSSSEVDCKDLIYRKLGISNEKALDIVTSIFLPVYRAYQIDPFFCSSQYVPPVLTFFGVVLCLFAGLFFGRFAKFIFFSFGIYLVIGYLLFL